MTDEIKVGAKVTLRGTVTAIECGSYKVDHGIGIHWFDGSDFHTVENPPEPLKVGDSVSWGSVRWTIKALDETHAWIVHELVDHRIIKISTLTRWPS